jgi:Flp pilus assembly pilin Flp
MDVGRSIVHPALQICRKAYRGFSALWHDESGAVATEYVVITAFLVIPLVLVAERLADAIRLWFWAKVIRIVLY